MSRMVVTVVSVGRSHVASDDRSLADYRPTQVVARAAAGCFDDELTGLFKVRDNVPQHPGELPGAVLPGVQQGPLGQVPGGWGFLLETHAKRGRR